MIGGTLVGYLGVDDHGSRNRFVYPIRVIHPRLPVCPNRATLPRTTGRITGHFYRVLQQTVAVRGEGYGRSRQTSSYGIGVSLGGTWSPPQSIEEADHRRHARTAGSHLHGGGGRAQKRSSTGGGGVGGCRREQTLLGLGSEPWSAAAAAGCGRQKPPCTP